MTINGFLESFSLPELLRLIDLGSKSGRLILQVHSAPNKLELIGLYHIWFQRGRLVAVINRLNHQSLIEQIKNQGWLGQYMSDKIGNLCIPNFPLGLYLEHMNLLGTQQLNSLFQSHLTQVYQLFEVPVGWFLFHDLAPQSQLDKKRKMPWLEMTGKSIRGTEASLQALRLQKNWDIFSKQLPESRYALEKLVEQPSFPLMPIESELWELADGQISLHAIAKKINQPLSNVQKVAFRLIMAGLVDEMPIVTSINSWTKQSSDRLISSRSRLSSGNTLATTTKNQQSNKTDKVSSSLLKTVINFLRRKFR